MPNINPKTKHFLITFLVSLVLGYFLAYQFNLQKKITKISVNNEDAQLAVEVAQLIKSNDDLFSQLGELIIQKEKLQQTSNSSIASLQSLESDITKYQILNGSQSIRGKGVTIEINEMLMQTQQVDLVNALRNIGFDAMTINGKRILTNASFIGELHPKIIIDVIGDPTLIKEGLERRGGILEQTDINANVKIKEILIIKKIND